MKKQYFAGEGEKGLTARKAQTLSLWAQKLLKKAWTNIREIDFVSCNILNSESKYEACTKYGTNRYDYEEEMRLIAKVDSFTSWVNEAIQEKEALMEQLQNYSIIDFARLKEVALPVPPVRPIEPTNRNMKDFKERVMYELWDRAKILKYFHLKNVCSTIHEVVGQDAPYERAYDELLKAIHHPSEEVWKGDKLYVRKFSAQVAVDDVKNEYERYQRMHNDAQSQLNGMEYELEQIVKQRYLDDLRKYQEDSLDYESQMRQYQAAFKAWFQEESEKVRNLKIIIPEPLMEVFNTIRSLGKEQVDME